MDPNNSEITDEGDSFDKLDFNSEIKLNEMDFQSVVEKIKKLEAELLEIKSKQKQNENANFDGNSMIQMSGQIEELKKEINGMKKEIEELKEGNEKDKNKTALDKLETENEKLKKENRELDHKRNGIIRIKVTNYKTLTEETGKLVVHKMEENKENEQLEETKDEDLKEESGKLEEMKEIERLEAVIIEKDVVIEELKEKCHKLEEKNKEFIHKEEEKKEIERLETIIVENEKDRAYEELKEKCKKLEKELAEKDCALKEMEKNKTTAGGVLELDLDPSKLEKIHYAFESLRSASSNMEIIGPIIELGLINFLIKALSIQDEKIQYEASCALTNIASGNSAQTWAIVEANGIEPLLKMCNSESNVLSEQALWVIANIAGDGAKCRDELIIHDVVPMLVKLADKWMNSLDLELEGTFACTIAWTIQNLCRYKPLPSYDVLVQLVPLIAALLKYDGSEQEQDIKLKIHLCWAVANLTSSAKENISLAVDFIPNMILFIKSGEEKLTLPALSVIGNFATGNDELTQIVVDCGVLTDGFPRLLSSNNNILVQKCCWIISNLLAGNEHQIQSVINAQLLPPIFTFLENCDKLLKNECGWAVANLADRGNVNQILEINRTKNGIEAICNNLRAENNDELVKNLLNALNKTLKIIDEHELSNLADACERVKKCGGFGKLMALKQKLESNEIAEMAQIILKKFFEN